MRFLALVLMAVLAGGWGLNLYKLSCADFAAPYKTEVIRGAAVFVWPVGCVIGYWQIGEEV